MNLLENLEIQLRGINYFANSYKHQQVPGTLAQIVKESLFLNKQVIPHLKAPSFVAGLGIFWR